MSQRSDAEYYARLEAGALYLAETGDPAAKAEHLKMARIYGRRAQEAAKSGSRVMVH